jgi:hypothetical protein
VPPIRTTSMTGSNPAARQKARIRCASRVAPVPLSNVGRHCAVAAEQAMAAEHLEEADLCIRFHRLGRTRLVNRVVITSDRRVAAWGALPSR